MNALKIGMFITRGDQSFRESKYSKVQEKTIDPRLVMTSEGSRDCSRERATWRFKRKPNGLRIHEDTKD
jgi:hypothetical protein